VRPARKSDRGRKRGLSIYLDVIWLLNFCFDLLLIVLTAIILKRRIKWRNVLLSALIGSLLVLIFFTPFANISSHPLTKFFVSCLMIITAFGMKRLRYILQNLLMFYFVSFVMGGAMIGTYYFFEVSFLFHDNMIMTNAGGFGDPISWLFIIIGFPIIWYYSRLQFDQVEETKIQFEHIVVVTILFMDRTISLKGLIDSGNQLYDPITKTPVMIVEMEKMKRILPEEMVQFISEKDPLSLIEVNEPSWIDHLRIIPYRAVGFDHQFLFAIKPQEIFIEKNGERIKVKKALVGINKTNLSSDGHYECILHPKMIQKGKIENAS
jgi:stage II sporulation protein GA (sporulation sigma-E factor processing peptidase)